MEQNIKKFTVPNEKMTQINDIQYLGEETDRINKEISACREDLSEKREVLKKYNIKVSVFNFVHKMTEMNPVEQKKAYDDLQFLCQVFGIPVQSDLFRGPGWSIRPSDGATTADPVA